MSLADHETKRPGAAATASEPVFNDFPGKEPNVTNDSTTNERQAMTAAEAFRLASALEGDIDMAVWLAEGIEIIATQLGEGGSPIYAMARQIGHRLAMAHEARNRLFYQLHSLAYEDREGV